MVVLATRKSALGFTYVREHLEMTQNIYVPPTNGTVRMTQPVLFKGVICYGPNRLSWDQVLIG
jgi:hypothetical protein